MTTIVEFPGELFRPSSIEPIPVFQNRSGGRMLTGIEDVVATDAGYWGLRLTFPIVKDAARRLWRGVRHQLEGRANILRIGLFECRTQPALQHPLGRQLLEPVPHDDDAFFDDDTGWQGQAIEAFLSAAIAARATTATIAVSDVWTFLPGHYFSIDDRLYIAKSVAWVDDDLLRVKFWPPARVAHPAAAPVEFDEPRGLFRLSDDGSGALAWAPASLTAVSLDLVEVIEALP